MSDFTITLEVLEEDDFQACQTHEVTIIKDRDNEEEVWVSFSGSVIARKGKLLGEVASGTRKIHIKGTVGKGEDKKWVLGNNNKSTCSLEASGQVNLEFEFNRLNEVGQIQRMAEVNEQLTTLKEMADQVCADSGEGATEEDTQKHQGEQTRTPDSRIV